MNEPMAKTYVGVNIGAAMTRLAIVDAFGRVLSDRQVETPTEDDGEALLRWLDEAYHLCRSETSSAPAPEAMGVGVPGILEPGRSAIIKSLHLPILEGFPLKDRLVERTGMITVVDCAAAAGAWGEFCVRQRQARRFAYLAIGSGVEGAVIIEGKFVRHTHHGAGHVGHLVCDTSEEARRCTCGAVGCLEAYVSGPAVDRTAQQAGIHGGIEELEAAYQENDPAAAGVVDSLAAYLSIGLLNLAHVYPVDLLVVGGSVAIRLPSLIRDAASLAGQSESTLVPERMHVELTALREYAEVVGAALLAAEHVSKLETRN